MSNNRIHTYSDLFALVLRLIFSMVCNPQRHCEVKAFEAQNDPTQSTSLIDLFELGRVIQ